MESHLRILGLSGFSNDGEYRRQLVYLGAVELEIVLTRAELYELVWQKPMSRLADEYSISGVGIAKLCMRHGIPTPERGYWAKVQAGKALPRPKLPRLRDAPPITLRVRGQVEHRDSDQGQLARAVAEASAPGNRVAVKGCLQAPCDLVRDARAALNDAKPDDVGIVAPPATCLDIRVSRAQLSRALRIADALLIVFDNRGWNVVVSGGRTDVHVDGVALSISIGEGVKSVKVPAKPDLGAGSYSFHYNRHETVRRATGMLAISICEDKRVWDPPQQRNWRGSEKRRLEERLDRVIVGMLKLTAAVNADAARRERQALEEEERRHRVQAAFDEQRRLREAIAEEQAMVDLLRDQAARWHEAGNLRQFVEQARERGSVPELGIEGQDRALDRVGASSRRQTGSAQDEPAFHPRRRRPRRAHVRRSEGPRMTRAAALEELELLVAHCRAGRLFDVQEWIRHGKPVRPPIGVRIQSRRHVPLRMAMQAGFHTLVQILLEAGAAPNEGNYIALEHAVQLRRPDLATLLFRYGAEVDHVSMRFVIEMWQPEMVDLFVSNGASLVREAPVAWGLMHKIRPVLGLLKRLGPDRPEVMRQADIALRFHAGEGSSKWVALTLWAGADPWSRGPDRVDDDDDDEHLNAIELAISRGHLDVLKQKKVPLNPDPARPETLRLIEQACHVPDSWALSLLLELGHRPDLLPDRGTAAITSLLHSMNWDFSFERHEPRSAPRARLGVDSSRARECMKMMHMLAAHGATWLPADKRAIADVRRSLLKMSVDYVLEFAWLMQQYRAARRRDVQELLRTPAMSRLLLNDRQRAAELVAGAPDEVGGVKPGAAQQDSADTKWTVARQC